MLKTAIITTKNQIVALKDSGTTFHLHNSAGRHCEVFKPDAIDKTTRHCDFAVKVDATVLLLLAELKKGNGEDGIEQLMNTATHLKAARINRKISVLVCNSFTHPKRKTIDQVNEAKFASIGYRLIRKKAKEGFCLDSYLR